MKNFKSNLTFYGLHVESQRAHELERVAPLHHPGAKAVIKEKLAVLQAVFEVTVGSVRAEALCDFCKGEVVGSQQADRATPDQAAHGGFRAQPPVGRVGALQKLVQKKKGRPSPGG